MTDEDTQPEASQASPSLLGVRPGTRVLVLGEVPEKVVDTVAELAPATLEVDHLREIRQAEWDAVATVSPPALAWRVSYPGRRMLDGVDAHLRVLAFLHGTTDVINTFMPTSKRA